jgi:hypothetical protein
MVINDCCFSKHAHLCVGSREANLKDARLNERKLYYERLKEGRPTRKSKRRKLL